MKVAVVGTGYLGRTGVYEMLEMTKPVVDAASQPDVAMTFWIDAGVAMPCSCSASVLTVGRSVVHEAVTDVPIVYVTSSSGKSSIVVVGGVALNHSSPL